MSDGKTKTKNPKKLRRIPKVTWETLTLRQERALANGTASPTLRKALALDETSKHRFAK